ncbi:hypothetical protein J7F03_38570 [Streptomyces sp. ISL-43]|uniref:PKD domain-containing protein n=1 Tax=Streptomyces sp. ISL-43 TaxID=2819183 RepID=UPI001BE99213|nr:PKD domain-containing protein [Streptomyces sp. ISL-43]MBT2452838.1 hypothetical protein [Streptomyces sp. ISL-43]
MTAHAADPVTPGAQGVAAPGMDLKKASEGFQTFTSPADRTVRKALSAAKGAAVASQAEAGNPGLGIVLEAQAVSAHGFELKTTVDSANTQLNVVIDWGDGNFDRADPYGAAVLTHTHTYAKLGEYPVKITVTDAANNAEVTNVLPLETAGSDFTPYGPTRLLDTRNGTGAAKAKVAPYATSRVKVAGNGKIPAGVTAVVLNVTVTNTTSAGHVTAFASGRERPTTSNVNFEAGQTVPNLVIVPVGKDGYVELYNGGWESVDLIADVTGYFGRKAAGGYTPRTPARIVDTRVGDGVKRGQVPGQGSFKIQMPAGLHTALALNVTVTNPRQDGHLTAYPSDQPVPTTSNVNFSAGQTVANSVIVPVAADGSVTIRNGSWQPTDVVVDLVGSYGIDSSGSFVPFDKPVRRLDTRAWDKGQSPARGYTYIPFSPGEDGVAGYVLNTTVTNTRGDGFLSVAPDPNTVEQYRNKTNGWPERPVSSALNWTAGKTVPNLVQASSGNNGIVDFWNQGWQDVDLIVDIFGYYDTK